MYDKLIFEISREGRKAYSLPQNSYNFDLDSKYLRQEELLLPEVSELDVVRHYTLLSQKNYGVDQGFYPLGSCTMKYNPKINEELASFREFKMMHPLSPAKASQGLLEIYYKLSLMLSEITKMPAFSLNPYAGAHGELTGLMIMREYHLRRGDFNRNKVIIPSTAHGTNPASTSCAGMEVIEVKVTSDGMVDLDDLKEKLSDEVAGMMLTNPNTVGIFEKDIEKISSMVHESGGLMYYDGANLNAILGVATIATMGFDIMHINLHKTFSTPHGGGGPGSGPVGVVKKLEDLLPNPRVVYENNEYKVTYSPNAIGSVTSYLGNYGVLIKAYAYILSLGKENIANVGKLSTLNANYIKESLKDDYKLPIKLPCKHEVVFDGLVSEKATTLEVAKRLLDYGYHPPTIYFPLLFHQALMIEPTECESKETLDAFISVMKKIALEAISSPSLLHDAPQSTKIKRLDEVKAARNPVVKYRDIL